MKKSLTPYNIIKKSNPSPLWVTKVIAIPTYVPTNVVTIMVHAQKITPLMVQHPCIRIAIIFMMIMRGMREMGR